MDTPESEAAFVPTAANFVEGLTGGDRRFFAWLHGRVRRRAAPRFSAYAWEWIGDDFLSELTLQLTVTVKNPGFRLQGAVGAYIDASIANLCKTYFVRLARLRRGDPIGDHEDRLSHTPISFERVAEGLQLRRALYALGRECRKLLIEKYAMGSSLKEIAVSLGVKPQTVQSRIHTCRERLRASWRSTRSRRPTLWK